MYNLNDYMRDGDDLSTAFDRMTKAIHNDYKAREDKNRFKQEILAECRAYIDKAVERAIRIQIDNQASPALKDLK